MVQFYIFSLIIDSVSCPNIWNQEPANPIHHHQDRHLRRLSPQSQHVVAKRPPPVTVLVVMNGVGRFLVPDVGTGDRVDDEAEEVELHHTSCVSPFAHHNDNLNQQTFK